MDEFLDIAWFKIVDLALAVVRAMDALLAPLHPLGPAAVIFLLAVATVFLTKVFKRFYTTRRYQKLRQEFNYWSKIRKEAMALEDRDKGKRMAKNIDQAELNRVYYDYFFEGLLNSILTTILPVLLMAAYVNEAYQPDKLQKLFGRSYVFRLPGSGGEGAPVGGLFWFVLSLVLVHILWVVAKRILGKKVKPDNAGISKES